MRDGMYYGDDAYLNPNLEMAYKKEITNVIIRDQEGEWDYRAEGYQVEILEFLEDAIEYKVVGDDEVFVSVLVSIDGNTAICKGWDK